MDEESLKIGDRVVNLQVPGIFRVVARRGDLLTIESERGGLRLVLHESALRKPLEDGAGPKPEGEEDG
jgi:hypothetical protein